MNEFPDVQGDAIEQLNNEFPVYKVTTIAAALSSRSPDSYLRDSVKPLGGHHIQASFQSNQVQAPRGGVKLDLSPKSSAVKKVCSMRINPMGQFSEESFDDGFPFGEEISNKTAIVEIAAGCGSVVDRVGGLTLQNGENITFKRDQHGGSGGEPKSWNIAKKDNGDYDLITGAELQVGNKLDHFVLHSDGVTPDMQCGKSNGGHAHNIDFGELARHCIGKNITYDVMPRLVGFNGWHTNKVVNALGFNIMYLVDIDVDCPTTCTINATLTGPGNMAYHVYPNQNGVQGNALGGRFPASQVNTSTMVKAGLPSTVTALNVHTLAKLQRVQAPRGGVKLDLSPKSSAVKKVCSMRINPMGQFSEESFDDGFPFGEEISNKTAIVEIAAGCGSVVDRVGGLTLQNGENITFKRDQHGGSGGEPKSWNIAKKDNGDYDLITGAELQVGNKLDHFVLHSDGVTPDMQCGKSNGGHAHNIDFGELARHCIGKNITYDVMPRLVGFNGWHTNKVVNALGFNVMYLVNIDDGCPIMCMVDATLPSFGNVTQYSIKTVA
ncbi:hypothetical protein CYMTET_12406 [Cymbomonas tetramitiformis]|uniref:Uncharacterized protein n=1 Tax=Cymbomonas tetramitiformis TaxID=36881 RepID=A0AAE0GKI0_9CHLO|nr:hypothetical protein CYMTET_12406 [Cymbomonas tetramitiformis]